MESSTAPNQESYERRRFQRLSLHLNSDMILFSGKCAGDQVTGKIINMSKVGVGAVLRSDIPPGTQLAITIYSDEDQSSCSGEVIWKKEIKGRTVHGIKINHWSYLSHH